MEIVTEPDIRSAEQARRYAEELQLLLRTIGASDADMERGQMRVEANVSLRPRGTEPFGTRVEVKNMNSFRSVERAIAFEIERQAAALDAGETLIQETRGWDDEPRRDVRDALKEESDDYRYFPEPDLPPLRVDAAWLDEIRGALPELPAARRARYRDELGLSAYDAAVIVAEPRRDRAVRGRARGRRIAEPQGGRQLGDRRVPAACRRPIRSAARRGSSPAELADLVGRVVGGRALADERQARSSTRSRRRAASRSARSSRRAACARSPTPARSARRRRRDRGQPAAPSPTTGPARAGDRVPRRPGHEGDARPGRTRRSSRRPLRERLDGQGSG